LKAAFRKVLAKIFLGINFLLPDKHFLINYYGGKIYLNAKEPGIMRAVIGVYENWKTKLFFSLVKEGLTCVDVGAHKGYFSLLFAKLMKDKGKVLAFDPLPENCFWLSQSIHVNKYKCIKVYQYALSDEEGTATLYPGKMSSWSSLFLTGGASTADKPLIVKTRRLDNVLNDAGINDIGVIKIDVEGAELWVLKGAENILKKSKNVKIVMEVHVQNKEMNKQIFEFLKGCGFKIYKVSKNLEPIRRVDEITKELYSVDIYATK